MTGRMRIGIACLVLVALAAAVTGCQAIAERATKGVVEKATGVKVDENGGSVTVTGKDGNEATFSANDKKLPDGLPGDFPVYAGDPETSAKAETPEGTTFSFTVVTADGVTTVFDWYKGKFGDAGWTIGNSTTSEVDGKQSGVLSAKKDKSEAYVSITTSSKDTGKTDVNVILTVKK